MIIYLQIVTYQCLVKDSCNLQDNSKIDNSTHLSMWNLDKELGVELVIFREMFSWKKIEKFIGFHRTSKEQISWLRESPNLQT